MIWCIVIPTLAYVGHFVAVGLLDEAWLEWMLSELGPIENLTAACFIAAGVAMISVIWRYRRAVSRPILLAWCLFAFASIFIGLEEISYGQHWFGWETQGAFAEYNKQNETNLHNLAGDRPSKLMRRIGEIGLPLWCIVLPLIMVFGSKDAYDPGHWPRYLLPKLELIWVTVLAGSLRWVDDWVEHRIETAGLAPKWDAHPDELMEFFWAYAGLALVVLIARRLKHGAEQPSDQTANDLNRGDGAARQ